MSSKEQYKQYNIKLKKTLAEKGKEIQSLKDDLRVVRKQSSIFRERNLKSEAIATKKTIKQFYWGLIVGICIGGVVTVKIILYFML